MNRGRTPGYNVQEHLLVRRRRTTTAAVVHVELSLHGTQLARPHVVWGHGAACGKGFPSRRRRHSKRIPESSVAGRLLLCELVVPTAGRRRTRAIQQGVGGQIVATRPALGDNGQVFPALRDLQLIV